MRELSGVILERIVNVAKVWWSATRHASHPSVSQPGRVALRCWRLKASGCFRKRDREEAGAVRSPQPSAGACAIPRTIISTGRYYSTGRKACHCRRWVVIDDAYSAGETMTRAELSGQVSWDTLFYSCYSIVRLNYRIHLRRGKSAIYVR